MYYLKTNYSRCTKAKPERAAAAACSASRHNKRHFLCSKSEMPNRCLFNFILLEFNLSFFLGCQLQTMCFFLSGLSLPFFYCIRNKMNLITVDSLQNTKQKNSKCDKNVTKCHETRVLESVIVVHSVSSRCFLSLITDWHFRPE